LLKRVYDTVNRSQETKRLLQKEIGKLAELASMQRW
jgi:hypothetical protein